MLVIVVNQPSYHQIKYCQNFAVMTELSYWVVPRLLVPLQSEVKRFFIMRYLLMPHGRRGPTIPGYTFSW